MLTVKATVPWSLHFFANSSSLPPMTYLESRGSEEAIVHPSGLFVKQMNIASNHTTLDLSADALAEVEQKMLVLSSEHFAE